MRALVICFVALVGVASGGGLALSDDEAVLRPPLADAAATMETILEALAPLPVRVLKLDVRYESATVRLDFTIADALEAAREALETSETLRAAARDPLGLVQVGQLLPVDGRLQANIALRFRHDHGAPAPARSAREVRERDMVEFAAAAGLRQAYASRQRVTTLRKRGLEIVSQLFEYEANTGSPSDLALPRLRRLCSEIGRGDLYRVTGVQWSRPSHWDRTTDLIRKPRIEVSVWQPVPGLVRVSARPGALAEAILRGSDADLEKAESVVAALDQDARLGLLREIRGQARIHATLDRLRVRELSLDSADLDLALGTVLEFRGLPWRLSARVRAELYSKVRVTLHLDDVDLRTALVLLTEPYGIRMVVRAGGVAFLTADEDVPEAFPEPAAHLLAKLETTKLTLKVEETAFENVVKYVQAMTGIEVRIDPRVQDELAKVLLKGIHVDDMPVRQILDMLAAAAGEDVTWTVKGEAIVFTKRH